MTNPVENHGTATLHRLSISYILAPLHRFLRDKRRDNLQKKRTFQNVTFTQTRREQDGEKQSYATDLEHFKDYKGRLFQKYCKCIPAVHMFKFKTQEEDPSLINAFQNAKFQAAGRNPVNNT